MTNLPLGKDIMIWFATGLSTSKIKDIKKNPTVSVFMDDPNDMRNASIFGKAEIVTDGRLLKNSGRNHSVSSFRGALLIPTIVFSRLPRKIGVPQSRPALSSEAHPRGYYCLTVKMTDSCKKIGVRFWRLS